MEPIRRPSGRRVLLPYELDLCEALGITPEDYWEFIFSAQETLKERGKEYAHIPDIRNEPITPTTLFIINLVVGVSLTAISMLLAPKPKSPSKRNARRLDIPGSQGRTRYTKSNNFDSIQQLANLGETIPLIFAERRGEYGGIRVETDMLLSQMLSSGNNQVLNALMTFGMGQLGARPDLDGFAIGDLLLRDFDYSKFRLYYSDKFENGKAKANRILNTDDYSETNLDVPDRHEDAFSVFSASSASWQPYFSGCRTPSTKTQFGCHNPIPNGHRFYLPLELVMVVDKSGNQAKEDSRAKREKLGRPYPSLCGLVNQSGREVIYKVDGLNFSNDPGRTDPNWAQPWGLTDVGSTMDERRIEADERLQPNQDFMVGTELGRVVSRNQSSVWAPENSRDHTYTFRLDRNVNIRNILVTNGERGGLDDTDEDKGGAYPWVRPTVQQCSIASLTNNRPCHATEIGIKSEVWRQITGSVNFNGFPTTDTVEEYEKEGGQITVGTITKYTKRYSFFTLYARPLGSDRWIDITGDAPFAVRGTSPISQYNTIYIDHPGSAASTQEFKIVPVPGAKFYSKWNKGEPVPVKLLEGNELRKSTSGTTRLSDYRVLYTGQPKRLTREDANNPEWKLNDASREEYRQNGPITALEKYTNGLVPEEIEERERVAIRYNPPENYVKVTKNNQGVRKYEYFWGGRKKGQDAEGDGVRVTETDGSTSDYERGDKEQEYDPPKWTPSPNSPDYLTTDFNENGNVNSKNTGMVSCVFKWPGTNTYYWQWNDENIWTQNSRSTGWKQKRANDGARYRIAQNEDGSLRKQTDEGFEYVNDPNFENVYKPDGNNRQPQTGVRVKNGVYEFYKNRSLLGTSNTRYLYMKGVSTPGGERGIDNRYQADVIKQDYEPEIRESLGRIRECYPEQNKAIALVVVDGAALQENMTIQNPNGNGQTKQVQRTKIMIDGVKVYDGPLYDWYGRKYKHIVGNKDYSPVLNGDYIECGPANNRSPVAKLQVDKVTAEKLEEWSLTYQKVQIVPESYEIEKEKYKAEVPGQFRIEKYKVETKTERRDRYSAELISEEEKRPGRGASVDVIEYKSGALEWRLADGGQGYEIGEKVRFEKESGGSQRTSVTSIDTGAEPIDTTEGYGKMTSKGNNYFPLNAVCDYFINSTDNSSHANGPEHNVVFCNEIIEQAKVPQYKDLALCGIKVSNSKEWTSFSNLSAWIGQGIKVQHLLTGGGRGAVGPTNLFPEIAYALLTDERIGAGQLIGAASVDKDAMELAAKFCLANDFYWDGVIAENLNLREFIFSNAGFILCDFTIKGGKFALVPSLPYGSDKTIKQDGKPDIRALFTDSNMRAMRVTFLSPEQRQMFKAVMMYRQEKENGFAETRTMTIRLKSGTASDPIEEFDMTQFCTSEKQARWFGRIALKLREKVDHGITFETTPQSAMNLQPGEYFKVASKVTHTDRFQSGSVTPNGDVISSEGRTNASIKVVYWKPGSQSTDTGTLNISQGKTTQTAFFGTLWAKVVEAENTRVYKVETLSYSEDGLVSVSGSFVPLTDDGTLAILDWSEDDFVEELA